MPTYYETAVGSLEFQLSCEEYQDAWMEREQLSSPLRRPAVRAGLCLTAALLSISAIPWYSQLFPNIWAPLALTGVFCLAALFFALVLPRNSRVWAAKIYHSNQLLACQQSVVIYRDSMTCKNQYENYKEYWTDFSKCLETDRFFLLSGGVQREFLVLPKKDCSAELEQLLSSHFQNTFVARYHRVKGAAHGKK